MSVFALIPSGRKDPRERPAETPIPQRPKPGELRDFFIHVRKRSHARSTKKTQAGTPRHPETNPCPPDRDARNRKPRHSKTQSRTPAQSPKAGNTRLNAPEADRTSLRSVLPTSA